MKKLKQCGHCQTEFLSRPNRQYCSDACKRQAQQARHPLPTPADPQSGLSQGDLSSLTRIRSDKPLTPALIKAKAECDQEIKKLDMLENEKARRYNYKVLKSSQKHDLALKAALPGEPLSGTVVPLASLQAAPPAEPIPQPLSSEDTPDVSTKDGLSLLDLVCVGTFLFVGAAKVYTYFRPQPVVEVACPADILGFKGIADMVAKQQNARTSTPNPAARKGQ